MFNSNRNRIAILLIISVIAVAASVVLLPTWGEDVSAEEAGDYVVSDSSGDIGEYSDLGAAFTSINNTDGSDFTITVRSDHEITGAFVVNTNKNITLISPAGELYTLTVTSAVRHFTVNGGGSLTLENIILDGSSAGGGIEVKIAGILTMNDGAMIQNCKSTNGGGVSSAGKFTMNGGVITSCTATNYGGGVYNTGIIGQTSSFTMNGGEISGNNASSGGGVYTTAATFTMNGGKISNNKADSGGGVYNYFNTIFNLSSGKISDNAASSGGGVYNMGTATFTISGGEVSGNKATIFGGGVYNDDGTALVMTGGEITNNAASSGGGVYTLGKFDLNGGNISENTAVNGGGVFNQNLFTLENGEISNNTANNGGGVYNTLGSSFDMGGSKISGNTATTNGGGIYNYFNVKFTMSGGEVSGNTSTVNGGGMYNYLTSLSLTFNISGNAAISNNKAGGSGGGVYNLYSSTISKINMSDNATISNNTAGGSGGGVYGGSINMTGGEISNNTAAANGGGVYVDSNVSLVMSDNAVISNNTANLGGGIFNYGSLNITGGTIGGNTATGKGTFGSGGGIYTTNFAKVIVKDGVVFTDNKAPALREYDIPTGADMDNNKTADLDDYKNIGAVVLDASALGYNAPAYNNYDINYPDAVNAVKVSIVPNGGGTVTVTDSANSGTVYGILVKDGYIYVPASVKTINISAAPADGNAFVQFSVDKGDPNTSDSLKSVPISGEMTIDALFKAPEFTITASADDNSTISPGGDVTVSAREDAKFTFSADPGYKVTAVYVDGEAISSEELASGEYTFLSVIDNHTISVVSEAVVETGGGNGGGTGSGSGTGGSGTGNSNGNGSAGNGGGTDVGGGDIETGSNPSENDNTGVTPVVTETGEWSVISMICAVIAVFAGVIALVAGRDRFRTDDEERRSKTGITLRVLALIIGIVSVIVFFLKEDWSLAPVAISTWTPLIFVLLLATLVLAMVSFRFDKADS